MTTTTSWPENQRPSVRAASALFSSAAACGRFGKHVDELFPFPHSSSQRTCTANALGRIALPRLPSHERCCRSAQLVCGNRQADHQHDDRADEQAPEKPQADLCPPDSCVPAQKIYETHQCVTLPVQWVASGIALCVDSGRTSRFA